MDLSTATRRLRLHARYADDDVAGLAAVVGELVGALDAASAAALLRHAYWRMDEVPTAALERGAGGWASLRAAAGPGYGAEDAA